MAHIVTIVNNYAYPIKLTLKIWPHEIENEDIMRSIGRGVMEYASFYIPETVLVPNIRVELRHARGLNGREDGLSMYRALSDILQSLSDGFSGVTQADGCSIKDYDRRGSLLAVISYV